MGNVFIASDLNAARDVIWSGVGSDSAEYSDALSTLANAMESGALEYAGTVAEALAFPGPNYDPERAYVLYHVAYKQDGYSVAWANEVEEPNHYLGPVGDFRNEAIVSDLIRTLGVAALPALDVRARTIMRIGI